MAEVLGLAANIIAVLQVTTSVASLSYQYLNSAVRAPDSLRELTLELQTLISILSSLKICAQDPQAVTLRGVESSLHICHKEMLRLQEMLKPRKGTFNWLRWPFQEKDIRESLLKVERFKSSFSLALEVDQAARVNLVANSVRKVEIEIGGLSDAQNCQTEREKEQKRRDALNWLFPEPCEKRHIEISSQRKENTGQWIFRTQEVQGWIKGNPNCRLLWGYGIPGAGKTFLSSLVVDHIEGLNANNGVGYIYFNFKEQEQQTPVNTLSSLVKQLAFRAKYLPQAIEDAHKENKRPTLDQLYEVLVEIGKSFTQTFLVFDALDECHQVSQREKLLPMFHRMGDAGMNLFLTGREYPEDVQESFTTIPKLRLWAKDEDISSYIEQKIADFPRAKRLILSQGNNDLKEKIISALQECANGMFLLVRFHIECLCQQTTLKQIFTELESIKSSTSKEYPMDPTYERAWKNIHMQPQSCIKLALRVISWLTKARRVLTVRELQLAVSVEKDNTTFDEDSLPDRKTLLDVCASLVTIDEGSGRVRFVHFTTQEFLVRKQLVPDDADLQVAIACTTFLSYDVFSAEPCANRNISTYTFPLIVYAARELTYHLKKCDELLTKMEIIRFLDSKGNIHSYMHQIKYMSGGSWRKVDADYTYSALELAVSLGNNAVVAHFLRKRENVNSPHFQADLTSPLLRAVRYGNYIGIKLLLESGADPNIQNSDGDTALILAAYNGHEAIVKLLLESGADPNIQSSKQDTALILAASDGHETTVKLLLETGADPNIQSSKQDTALILAAWKGHETTVKRILESGAGPNIQDSDGDTALIAAAYQGHEAIVKLLLETGADPNIQSSKEDTALILAASWGHEAIVKLLLESGADPNIQGSDEDTALILAVRKGHETTVKLLLESGADPNIQGSDGDTALILAAREGQETTVKLLLESGADPNIQDLDGHTALILAASWGHETTVKLLLEHGADPNIQDSDGNTALILAARNGHETTVKLLLESGADPNIQDSYRYTALILAARNWHETTVKLLLESGADPNIQSSNGNTALILAARKGYETTVKLLLESGADPNVQQSKKYTALILAASWWHETTVKLLLEHGAYPNIQDLNGDTALDYAKQHGYEVIIQMLENAMKTNIQSPPNSQKLRPSDPARTRLRYLL